MSFKLTGAEPASAPEVFDQTHSRYAGVLRQFVSNGRVDYVALRAKPGELNTYLEGLAAVKPADFAGWTPENRLALLLNLYNAWTLRLIADHYPVKSIRDIGTLPGAAWRELIVRFGGQIMSLDHLENKVIRANYHDPRIHLALVCAAMGCPPLRSDPYQGSQLDRQLADQGRTFLATPEKNRFDPDKCKLWLSPIFKWYKEDFTGGGQSLQDFVRPYLPEASRHALGSSPGVKIAYTDYDWALNEWSRQ
jgi:hypothetical protein